MKERNPGKRIFLLKKKTKTNGQENGHCQIVTIWKHAEQNSSHSFHLFEHSISQLKFTSFRKWISFLHKYIVIINAAVLSLRFKNNETERRTKIPAIQHHIQLAFYYWGHYFWDRQSCSFPNIFFYYHRIISWYSPFIYMYPCHIGFGRLAFILFSICVCFVLFRFSSFLFRFHSVVRKAIPVRFKHSSCATNDDGSIHCHCGMSVPSRKCDKCYTVTQTNRLSSACINKKRYAMKTHPCVCPWSNADFFLFLSIDG